MTAKAAAGLAACVSMRVVHVKDSATESIDAMAVMQSAVGGGSLYGLCLLIGCCWTELQQYNELQQTGERSMTSLCMHAQGSVATSPLPSPASAAASAAYGHSQPGSPPVRDMRELLGDRATTLQVGPKVSTDSLGSSSGGGRPAVQPQQAAPQTPVAPK